MSTTKPRIFIGSSAEGLPIAEAFQQNLDHYAEVTIWSQGVFGLSVGSLESLVGALSDYDFAILVLTPDDLTESRGESKPSPRDNVLFELGLFMGRLGRERVFIVHERSTKMKIPSDLAGIMPANFARHSSGNLQASVGSASTRIKNVVVELGRFSVVGPNPIDATIGYQVLADMLETVAVQFFILMGERSVRLQENTPYTMGEPYEYHEPTKGSGSGSFDVARLCARVADADLLSLDLRHRVSLTARGKAFAEWAASSDRKVAYFATNYGGWGTRPTGLSLFDKPTHLTPDGAAAVA